MEHQLQKSIGNVLKTCTDISDSCNVILEKCDNLMNQGRATVVEQRKMAEETGMAKKNKPFSNVRSFGQEPLRKGYIEAKKVMNVGKVSGTGIIAVQKKAKKR
jgi:hypothetical protein